MIFVYGKFFILKKYIGFCKIGCPPKLGFMFSGHSAALNLIEILYTLFYEYVYLAGCDARAALMRFILNNFVSEIMKYTIYVLN